MAPLVFFAFLELPDAAAPVVEPAPMVETYAAAPFVPAHHALVAADPFSALDRMEADDLAGASGGSAHYAIDLDAVGVNLANTDANITDSTITTSGDTGQIDRTSVTDNSGITTVFVNSGNGVVFQNTTQINIYAPTGN